MFNKHGGGFVLVEFAIALPLLILLGWGLANVSLQIFRLGKTQLADYVLEAEAQYVMERITHQARTAQTVTIEHVYNDIDQIEFVYHSVNDHPLNPRDNVADVWETQIFIPRMVGGTCKSINAKRLSYGSLSNPITGENSFGDTKINAMKFDLDEAEKILHVTLEMESVESGQRLRINTAIFMPGLNS